MPHALSNYWTQPGALPLCPQTWACVTLPTIWMCGHCRCTTMAARCMTFVITTQLRRMLRSSDVPSRWQLLGSSVVSSQLYDFNWFPGNSESWLPLLNNRRIKMFHLWLVLWKRSCGNQQKGGFHFNFCKVRDVWIQSDGSGLIQTYWMDHIKPNLLPFFWFICFHHQPSNMFRATQKPDVHSFRGWKTHSCPKKLPQLTYKHPIKVVAH